MNRTTVFLDAGGVILDETDSEKMIAGITVDLLKPYISSYALDDYFNNIDEAVRCFCPNTYKFVYWKHLKEEPGLYNKLYSEFLRILKKERPPIKLMDGFKEEAAKLTEFYDLGIAGQYGNELLTLLKSHDLLDCFKYQFTQDDFNITKPDPRYLEAILKKCNVEAGKCIMVGDRIDKDIIPAKQVGMKTVLFRTGLHKKQQARIPEEIPHKEIFDIKELTKVLLIIEHKRF